MNPFQERKTIWFWQAGQYPEWKVESGWIRLNIVRTVHLSQELKDHLTQARRRFNVS